MIRRVRVQGYKSLRDLDVTLRPLSVLLGPNAAGKSNFLDALQLLSRAVTSRSLKEAFEPPYRGKPLESFSFGPNGLAAILEHDRLELVIEVDVALSDRTVKRVEKQIREMRSGNGSPVARGEAASRSVVHERLLRYRLAIEAVPRSGIVRVSDEMLTALRENGEPKTSRKPFLDKQNSRLRLRLEGQAHPTYHEVGLDHTLLSQPLYPPHYPHLTALREELSDWAFFYFEPRERMRASNPVEEVRHIGMMGEDLAAFLNTLRATDSKQFHAIEKALHALVPQVSRIEAGPNKLGEVELELDEGGVMVPTRLVSEGTLRMLGLLAVASAKEPSTLVAFEEPENGIHPRRLRLLAEFLRSRAQAGSTQFIVTTHSSLLADLLPPESLFLCRREDGRTLLAPLHVAEGPLFRRSAIDRGLEDQEVERVSERILRGDFDG